MTINPATLDIASLPSVTYGQWSDMPHTGGVYLAIGGDGQILYIGQSNDLHSRWRGLHHCKPFLKVKAGKVAWVELCDKTQRLTIERQLITHFKPLLNESKQPKPKADRPVKTLTKRTEVLATRIDPELKAQLERAAEILDRPLSWVLKKVLEIGFEEYMARHSRNAGA